MEDMKQALETVGKVPQNEISENTVLTCSQDYLQSKIEDSAEDQSTIENPSSLDMSGKMLESLSVLLSSHLQVLNISNNQFKTLPDEIHQLINLASLAVCQNNLQELPDWIGDLRNLVSLKLSFNNLQSLPLSFSRLNLLGELDLSKNKFFKIPDSLQVGCISLQSINLAQNYIENWICCPASVSTLQTICLAQNLISSVPLWLCDNKASSLISLDLSLNPVFSQKQKLSKTAHKSVFKQLNLSHSFLCQRDLNFVGQFTTLTHLQLSNHLPKGKTKYENIVREIDVSALQFRKSLIQLLIRDLSLVDLPEDIQELVSLEVLDCRDNNILLLPDSICKLPRLRVCLLSNNSLCVLPEKFGELTSLRELRAETNNISCLPESFGNLQNLCLLDLYGNIINEVPNQLAKIVENLQGLDFEFNHVSLCSELEDSEDGVTWLSKDKYELLLKELRSRPVCLSASDIVNGSSVGIRVVGCRPPSVEKDEYSSCESSHGKYSDYDSDDSNHDEKTPAPEYEEEDDWNISDTDNFDAVEYDSRPKPPIVNKPVVIVPPDIIQRHRFCPSDMHVPPTKENTSGVTYAPEEGQFDDAESRKTRTEIWPLRDIQGLLMMFNDHSLWFV